MDSKKQIWVEIPSSGSPARDEHGSGLDETAIVFQNWRMRTGSDLENFCYLDVIIPKISKILVVIRFHRFSKW